MGYRVDRNLKEKEAKNRRLKNRSLLIAVVFIMSIISNSITPKTLLASATENNKFEIENVSVEESVTSDDIFVLTREAEKVSENEIKISLNIKINKDNIPVVNNELNVEMVQEIADNEPVNIEQTEELTENEATNIGENQEEVGNEAIPTEEIQESSEGEFNNIDEKSVEAENLLNNIVITESLIEGFNLVNDSIKLEEVKEEGNTDITEALINSEYTDLTMESLENKLDITIKNSSYTELKLSYSISTNGSIKALDNVTLFSEALLKYKLVENDEEKTVNIPNAVVLVKEVVVEKEGISEVEDETDNKQELQGNEEETTTSDNSTFTPETVTYGLVELVNNPEKIDFPVTIRDFNADSILFEAPLESPYTGGKGMVSNTLGIDKKPVFLGGDSTRMDSLAEKIRKNFNEKGTYDDAKKWYDELDKTKSYNEIKKEMNTAYKYLYYNFKNLFTDVSGLNMQDDEVIKKITLNKDSNSTKYTFDSKIDEPYASQGGFFPFDNEGYGNYENSGHNFHFTLESHSRFWVGKNDNLVFNFTGDDDVWVYVNGQLVIDIGGVHGREKASFTIKNGEIKTSDNKTIKLDTEKWVDFDFFYMERHTTQSNLKIETNINFKPNMTIEKQAYLIDSKGQEIILNNNDRVYPGETVYYKFIIKNKGNVDLTNISFQDDNLKIKIDSDGVYKKNQSNEYESINYDNLTIIKNGTTIDSDKLSALNNLPLKDGEDTYIEIKSKDFLKYTVKESDIPLGSNSGEITNRVIGKANYYTVDQGTMQESAEATVTVIPTPITEEIVKLDAKITKSIDKIIRNGEIKYPNAKNELPRLVVGDKVTFKFDIKNNSTSRSISENGQVSEWVPVAIEGLKLDDTLSINGDKYTKTDFTYYELGADGKKVPFSNYQKFELGAANDDSRLTLYSDWTVLEEEANHYNYKLDHDVTNTIKLSKTGQGSKELDTSSVEMKIQPPSLLIEKVIADGSLSDSYLERTFTIMVKGDNGKQYNIEAEASTESNPKIYTLDNLKYGVIYTVSEIVPMNYEQPSITINNEVANSIKLTVDNSGSKVQIINKKVNDKFWTDNSKVINTFEYKTNINAR